jgi:choline dehydrogenase
MYDYIIAGAGSAGCVLAHRLSEDPRARVLLIEAGGPDKRQEIHIPAAFSKLFKTEVDWAYETEPQPQMEGRRMFWPRGKVLGGSSSINAMIYSRGNRRDHDRWADFGVTGWGYRDILPYYKKSENFERGANEYHGAGGPLNVTHLRTVNPLSYKYLEATQQVGFTYNEDFNGAAQEGVGHFQVTQKGGKRHSAAAAYLKPALARPNLEVRTHAHVTRVLFNGPRAIGVAYVREGKTEEVRASREVILTGGSINSPQLLMLSGIGPADHLRALDIPVMVDLPGVGENLQDHLLIGVEYELTKPIGLHKADNLSNILKFLVFKSGPLTSNVAEVGGFIKTRAGLDLPDIELLFAPVFYMNHGFGNPDAHGVALGVAIQHPDSRGQIRLRSDDPLAAPLIQPNYLAAESDLACGIEGVKVSREIAATKFFDGYRGKEIWPGPEARSDDAIADHIRRTSDTLYHPIGTCRMGTDKDAVVDGELRVRGVEGLRVVDASVIPIQATGHTNAVAIMVAEKAADLISHG